MEGNLVINGKLVRWSNNNLDCKPGLKPYYFISENQQTGEFEKIKTFCDSRESLIILVEYWNANNTEYKFYC